MDIRDIAKALGVSVEDLMAWAPTIRTSAATARVREYDAKINHVRAEAARAAGEYQSSIERLTEERNAVAAALDAELGR